MREDREPKSSSVAINLFVYSDSTAMPKPEYLSISESWPFLLKAKIESIEGCKVNLVTRFMAATTAKEMQSIFARDSTNFGFKEVNSEKNIVVFSFGVNDAAPRPITYALRKITKIRFFGPKVWKVLEIYLVKHKKAILKIGRYRFTRPRRFEAYLRKSFQMSLGVHEFLLLTTPMPHTFLEIRTPGFRNSVMEFNARKIKVSREFDKVRIVDLAGFGEELYISKIDGHHFLREGHEYVCDEIFKAFDPHEWNL